MATITKKELIDRIAEQTQQKRVHVKRIVQQFLDEVIAELGKGNRLEFRDFGVFETRLRKARRAQNPKTLAPVAVPQKRTVKFKVTLRKGTFELYCPVDHHKRMGMTGSLTVR